MFPGVCDYLCGLLQRLHTEHKLETNFSVQLAEIRLMGMYSCIALRLNSEGLTVSQILPDIS